MLTLLHSSYFLICIFAAFYLPGRFFLKSAKLKKMEETVLSLLLGLVLWGWQGFIFGYLHVRWFSYLYLLFFFGAWFKYDFPLLMNFLKSRRRKILPKFDIISLCIIVVGSLIQLTVVWFVGTKINSGLYFCCGNVGDNNLHISITNEMVKRFPPYEPGMYGVYLQNYHYWGNLVVAELVRVFNLPLIPTLFRSAMIFLSILLGLSAIVFSRLLKLPRIFYRWLLFFLYFGGDAIFFLILLLRRTSFFEMSSLEDGAKFLANPPRAFANVLFFAGMCLFILWNKKRQIKLGILSGLVLGTLIGFKAYVGFFALSGLGFLALYKFFKKQYGYLWLFLFTVLVSLIIYLPVNKGAGGLYYTGFWRFENFISQPALGLIRLEMAREIFIQHNNLPRIILQEVLYFVIFMSAIFGTKLLGLLQTRKSLNLLPKEINIILLGGIMTSFVLGNFFEQTSGQANTFNFLVSIFVFGSIYSALACYYWLRSLPRRVSLIAVLVIVLLTVPRVMYEAYHNISDLQLKNGYTVSNDEMEGMNFLRDKTAPDSLVLINNNDFLVDRHSPYISYLSDRPIFLSGIDNELISHGINHKQREIIAKMIFSTDYPASESAAVLFNNKIDLILTKKDDRSMSSESAEFTKTVFENDALRIKEVYRSRIQNYLQYNSQ